ncbi:histidine phosphatase family protein [Bacillus sp. FJAT-42376]|uniref:histidine phosphatase family protein n=1 Tax=Bacillus sp. FJAT-42376 TaxID=2014076 RepID=UPI000F50EC8D|nr:histidine phosphatase family protein [Bacillus sp. FJAT-42376]AZB41300.1 histidine phosphatase family protein [Bacillus sp. FJAT-42376]
MKKKIYLIRHCKANGQEAEATLTAEGEVQAVSLSAFLTDKNIKVIYSSPYKRAVDSISPFAGQNRLNITIDRRLEERILSKENLHDWMDKLSQTFVDKTLCFGGGESSHYAASRGLAVIRDFLDGPFQTAAIVSHGNLISLILNHFDETFGFEQWKTLSNPDVYLLEFEGSTPAIRRVWDGL